MPARSRRESKQAAGRRRPGRGRWRRLLGRFGPEALLIGLLALLLAAPRWVQAEAALEWGRYHARGAVSAKSPDHHTRELARWAGRALERLAPLPDGAAAARLALDTARVIRPSHPLLARRLCGAVANDISSLDGGRWRRLGLSGLEAEARRGSALTAPSP